MSAEEWKNYKWYCVICDGLFNSLEAHKDHLGVVFSISDTEKAYKEEVQVARQDHRTPKGKTMKWNYVEASGNLAKELKVTEKATFARVALWVKKAEDGKEDPKTTFVDVAFFGKAKEALDKLELKVGQGINFSGSLSTREGSNGFAELSLVGYKVNVVERKAKATNEEAEASKETKE